MCIVEADASAMMVLASMHGALTAAQLENALAYISATSGDPIRDELILWLAIFAGMRAHEIAHLPLDAMTDEQGRVRNQISLEKRLTKYGPARAVSINQRTREAIVRFRTAHPEAKHLRDLLGAEASQIVRKWLATAYEAIGYVDGATSVHLRNSSQPGKWLMSPLSRFKVGSGSLAPTQLPKEPATLKEGRPKFRHADIVRAVRATQRAGLDVTASELTADGTIRLSHAAPPASASTAYDKWKEGRGAVRS
jgi:hypothetical protein